MAGKVSTADGVTMDDDDWTLITREDHESEVASARALGRAERDEEVRGLLLRMLVYPSGVESEIERAWIDGANFKLRAALEDLDLGPE